MSNRRKMQPCPILKNHHKTQPLEEQMMLQTTELMIQPMTQPPQVQHQTPSHQKQELSISNLLFLLLSLHQRKPSHKQVHQSQLQKQLQNYRLNNKHNQQHNHHLMTHNKLINRELSDINSLYLMEVQEATLYLIKQVKWHHHVVHVHRHVIQAVHLNVVKTLLWHHHLLDTFYHPSHDQRNSKSDHHTYQDQISHHLQHHQHKPNQSLVNSLVLLSVPLHAQNLVVLPHQDHHHQFANLRVLHLLPHV